MKRFLALFIAIITLFSAVACTALPRDTIEIGKSTEGTVTTKHSSSDITTLPSTPTVGDTTKAPEPIVSPDGERKPFSENDFISVLNKIDVMFDRLYIREYDKVLAMTDLEAMYYEGLFDELTGDDLTLAVANQYIYLLGDPYGQYFTKNAYDEYINDMSTNDYVGVGITVLYFENIEYPADKSKPDGELCKGGAMIVNIDPSSNAIGVANITDVIIRVNGKAMGVVGYEDAVNMITGEAGTRAEFTVLRNVKYSLDEKGESFVFDTSEAYEVDLSVERKSFERLSVNYEMLENNIGYIYISEFNEFTAKQFLSAFVKLIDGGAEDFIFDVRSNPGGTVDSTVTILSTILDYDKNSDKTAVFSVADKYGNEDENYIEWSESYMDYYDIDARDVAGNDGFANIAEEYAYLAQKAEAEATRLTGAEKEKRLALAKEYKRYSEFDFQLPKGSEVVVLTNGSSASGAELFTKILSDYGVATVVGEKTFGKGSMQSMYYMNGYNKDEGVLKISAHTYKSPYSDNYDGKGIEPDEKVELDSAEALLGIHLVPREDDTQLAKAIQIINEK